MRNTELATKLEQFESLLKSSNAKPLNFIEAAKYLSISQSTLYKLTYQRKIPSHKPTGKLLYFFKHELDEWISSNAECRTKSVELKEDDDEEDALLLRRRRKRA
jgi:excisionase family DNA binding protein